MGQLDGRVAFITGGARGQGRAHALALAAEGADVVVTDIAADLPGLRYPLATPGQLAETVKLIEEYGVRAAGLQVDARDSEQINAAVAQTVADFGRIDILLANHGVVDFSTVEQTTDELWNAVVETNLTGIFKAIRAVIPQMRAQKYGRIIATASMGARNAAPNLGHYIAAKWGVIGLVKTTALEVAGDGITVNVVAPGAVDTDLFFNQPTYDVFLPDVINPTEADFRKRLDDLDYGLNGVRFLQPEDVSRAVLYLVTDRGLMTGQVLEIGLGTSAHGIY
ncbi:3-ketoacyl-ACP reductase [Mycobacterium sp. CBMA 234]|uniref:mycofactocin-coupled SDR family oxidoreductase n=1 Tax=Mycolicibacterium sp. CBMA 234 TaxID=1918495 RepID=UPI0012DBFFBC|nr:mycofactocin-coupled SDR family oxidoreductase [Mycolicibacterium sp. CBMA 234]MUL64565.1 3-ketoacyl-ACP reductase [Mycolicibacterium sp. CBMA 234]